MSDGLHAHQDAGGFPTDLSAAFDFDAEDLEANRAGLLSQRQRQCLDAFGEELVARASRGAVAVGGVALSLAVAAFALLALDPSTRAAVLGQPIVLLALVLAVGAPVSSMAAYRRMVEGHRAGLHTASLTVAEGDAHLTRPEPGRGHRTTTLSVGDTRFAPLPDHGPLFQAGVRYRVCYVRVGPHERILSVEELG